LPESQSPPHKFEVKTAAHPNKLPFEGVLTRLDTPSDKSPTGARGHLVILTREAAEQAIPTLIGMAVGFANGWDTHDPRQKCGIITNAWIEEDELQVSGYVYARDFADVVAHMRKPDVALGMSYEMVDARVADMREAIWRLTHVTFTGAAILLRDKAAYRTSSIALSASAEEFNGRMTFVGQGSVRLSQAREGRLQRFVRRLRSGR
jgi:hypothetical protein